MNAKNVNEILDALAARLSVPASHLWGVLVRQAAVEFWTSVAVAVFLAAFALFATRTFARLYAKHSPDRGLYSDWTFVEVAWCGASCIATLAAVVCAVVAVSNIGYLANPEYYALHSVLSALR